MERITRRIGKSIDFVDGRGYAKLSHEDSTRLLFERLVEYEELGTVDELAELRELQIPKKPSVVGMQNKCPNIDCFESVLRYYTHCSVCGQKIDWNKD